eukprot:TRINITY_DN37380_c0_g1_i1.p1 TRINITY_DN37380_c0_g1~~TRINITY_DN37380_c0_g1_i1.p1  ORF type:complete len:907 (-),score=171.96 TRINITY_DN37380_c0_g1_i1:221-2941(-)
MGCISSTADSGGDIVVQTIKSEVNEAVGADSKKAKKLAHKRLKKLKELDENTKIPFILIELTGEGDGKGEIEVCGKDEYGVYHALDEFFINEWGCEKLDPGDLSEETKVPFCALQYLWPGYQVKGEEGQEGINNMGRSVMKLVDFMSGKLSWTLAVINSGNVGASGEVHEMQVVFKAPHPMNMAVPHLMVEMRSEGFIEVCADLDPADMPVLDRVDQFFAERFAAESLEGYEDFCDRYYKVGDGVFKGVCGSADSNFGLLTILLCDTIVQIPGWSLVATSCGSTGASSEFSEQQMIFRRDYNPLGDSSYVQVILNESGNIEVNGQENGRVIAKLHRWLQKKWGCIGQGRFKEGVTICARYSWPAIDFMQANVDIIGFFEMEGYETQVLTTYMISEEGQMCREQQLFFRPGKTDVGTIEPHLIIELYAGEGSDAFYQDEAEPTQILAKQYIAFSAVSEAGAEEVSTVQSDLENFVVEYLGGAKDQNSEINKYFLNVFMCRGWYENNLAQWTMRLCDFMVDKHGWSFVVCSLCNSGEHGQFRKQQLIFHWEGDKRDVPVSSVNLQELDPSEWEATPKPDHWSLEPILDGSKVQDMVSCSPEELQELQNMFDASFKRVLTRDRQPDDDAPEDEEMPYRLECMHAFRNEHSWLHHRFETTRADLAVEVEESFPVKTTTEESPTMLERLPHGCSYLLHGTNPSSAMSILKQGFQVRHAGSATGTMYGNGIYMAECSSKSDEYSRDDGGNCYPGLLAILVCRTFVGNPFVVYEAGDHVSAAAEMGNHCVCGDRESAKGTYREFVFHNATQIYPEYAVIYRRVWEANAVPEHMRVKTSGTTGRFWQFRGDIFGFRGWKNVPVEVNKVLIAMAQKGRESARIPMKGRDLVWNMAQKTVQEVGGDKSSPIRPPMQ